MLADRLELDAERIVIDAVQIAELRGVKIEIVLLAAHFMKQKRLRTFDAVHAALAFDEGDPILSSGKAFECVGLVRIHLEET